ncbi:type IV secretion system protein VirB2 [Bartonella sp. CDC_skunk]|uniref:TrbC/VirB2 family protein n=1 Tax=unclassified Bartonella TaxID=2645622 RepID=UPI00099A7FA6|nr:MULTISPECIES: TrbC/VirB2 family protein [unclassified Bartonella]AQX18461.1 type IV secretion system protein VirB2 [Bartonella sp. A1379B]AQX18480.1 type IV secretion system protein VirB2 [Bartonella sp. A1379B]AQX19100.1 type IV secretion system protein VirB2 [Bartonella sp. A1379B]AQX20732.1 type IV secretion system protein VirB2 [Bartonella sp. CDC_skunk]AQX21464.1 type IV secretion system protein VirB2 [Bartonella sp. CDC_skunk]
MPNIISKHIYYIAFALLLSMFAVLTPAYANSAAAGMGNLDTVLRNIVTMMTGTTAKLIATICVAAVGIGWMYGVIDLRKAAYCVLGIGIVFGASALVTLLMGSSS